MLYFPLNYLCLYVENMQRLVDAEQVFEGLESVHFTGLYKVR